MKKLPLTIYVEGALADEIGSNVMQQLADLAASNTRRKVRLMTIGETDYHDKTCWKGEGAA